MLAANAPGATFFLVDPLDGTREFLAGRDEYTVNIALVRDGMPVVGVVAAPALGLVWRGGRGPRRTAAACRPMERRASGPRSEPARGRQRARRGGQPLALSRRQAPRSCSASRRSTELTCGSALKFCRVAEGAADLYPRLAPTSEWDVAAGHALVVAAAGGAVTAPDGARSHLWAARRFSRTGLRRLGRSPQHGGEAVGLLGQLALDLGPARRGRGDHGRRIGHEGPPRFGGIEEIKPLVEHDPKPGKPGGRDAAARCRPGRSRRNAAYRRPGRPRRPPGCPHCRSARSPRHGGVRIRRGRRSALRSVK